MKPKQRRGRALARPSCRCTDLYDINGCDEEDILLSARSAGARIRLLKPMECFETW